MVNAEMSQELHDKFFKTGTPKRILALDGGGVRGALTLGYLVEVEKLLRKRFNKPDLVLAEYYDLIGGYQHRRHHYCVPFDRYGSEQDH